MTSRGPRSTIGQGEGLAKARPAKTINRRQRKIEMKGGVRRVYGARMLMALAMWGCSELAQAQAPFPSRPITIPFCATGKPCFTR